MNHTAAARVLLTHTIARPENLLTIAVGRDYADMVGVLVDAGMDAAPALHDAALKGRTDLVRMLLDKGVDIDNRSATRAKPNRATPRSTWRRRLAATVLSTCCLRAGPIPPSPTRPDPPRCTPL